MPKRNLGFRGISLKKELIDDVEAFVKEHQNMGYKNIAEFCAEAVRLRLDELRRNYDLPKIRRGNVMFINRKNVRVAEIHLHQFNIEDVHHILNLPELRSFLRKKGFTLETSQKL